ncbi:MAG: ABC transporter ATP-binding protein, partial [Gammaproteobacteria bacterium]|nr:ABC transporter ATP-binding protein [Gammaproteobacteria bacterium]
ILGILPGPAQITGGSILFRDNSDAAAMAGGTEVDIAKLDRDSPAMRNIRGKRISMIFQEPMTSLSPLHTVGDQVSEALRLHHEMDRRGARESTIEMLDLVGFPDPREAFDTYPFELSGGLRQRAMISMALICRPALLIADEPTTALDVTIQAQILSLLKELQSRFGMAVLLITHDLGVVANMADEVVVVYHGKLMESGPVDAIFTNPGHPYLKALMRAVPRVGMSSGERLTPIREVAQADGGHLTTRNRHATGDDGALLEVSGVTKRFSIRSGGMVPSKNLATTTAVDDVSFVIHRGECLGLVGESGCGKTTLSKIIMRAIEPDAGNLFFNDNGTSINLRTLRGDALLEFRKKVQLIFQDPFSSLNPRMTVFDIISEPLVIHGERNPGAMAGIVKELMGHVGLDPRYLSRYPHSFSGGQRQRIGIARALALNPDLLICDEPVSALDVSVQAQVLNLLKDLKTRFGLTYLFVSHNLAVVDYMADRIAVMCAGSLVEIAPREALFRRPVHPYTRALLAAVPRAELDRKLDLTALMEGRVSRPSAWPAPFTHVADKPATLRHIGDGHFVRASGDLGA